MAVKGLKAIKERSAAIAKARADSMANEMILSLKDGDIALFRFITDGDDFETFEFHSVPRDTKKGKTFYEEIICTGEDAGCEYHDEELDWDIVKTRSKMHAWIYVYSILRKDKKNDDDKRVTRSGEKFYREEINDFRIFKTGGGWGDIYIDKFSNYYSKHGTLCDRDYEWSRSGESMDTTYELLSEDKEPLDRDILKRTKALQDLADYVLNGPPNKKKENGEEDDDEEDEESLPLLQRLKRDKGRKTEENSSNDEEEEDED